MKDEIPKLAEDSSNTYTATKFTETDKLIQAIKMLLDIMLSFRKGYITFEQYCLECDNIEDEILSKYIKNNLEGK